MRRTSAIYMATAAAIAGLSLAGPAISFARHDGMDAPPPPKKRHQPGDFVANRKHTDERQRRNALKKRDPNKRHRRV